MNNDDAKQNGLRCLIVEDNIPAAEIMAIFFERNGIISETAENGQIGLQMYLGKPLGYDVIFLDLQMPVMDGYEMAKQVRESGTPTAGTIPIVAMSGTYTVGDAGNRLFNYFLRKPFKVHCLTEVINEVMQINKTE